MTLPTYYMTPTEFANLIVRSLEEQGYFTADQKMHPEDLVCAFVPQAEAIAKGASFVIERAAK